MGNHTGQEKHTVQYMMNLMGSTIRNVADAISAKETDEFIQVLLKGETDEKSAHKNPTLLNPKSIFVSGAGRSGSVAESFAMRLTHMGFRVYVDGETNTPALKKDDVMVIFSSSGDKDTLQLLVLKAHKLGGTVCLITSNPKAASKLGITGNNLKNKTCLVVIPESRGDDDPKSFAPLGTLFETASMIFADAVISRMMEETGIDAGFLKEKHTNLEGDAIPDNSQPE